MAFQGNSRVQEKLTISTEESAGLEVKDVSKFYSPRRLLAKFRLAPPRHGAQALSSISFKVRPNETLGLLGPNGAGKTTLLKIIATVLYPNSGSVTLFGHNIFEHPQRSRRMMGLVTSDERSFYWRLTGRQNLSFFAALYDIPPRKARERVATLLDVVGLSHAADRPFHGYSSGMKQKLAIARGLLSDPRLILYDEPTRSLDPLSAQTIRNWIIRRREDSPDRIHLLATNQLQEAEQLCDKVVILNTGSVIARGTIGEIRQRFQTSRPTAHNITFSGMEVNGHFQSEIESGLLTMIPGASGATTSTLRLVEPPGGKALTRVLDTIIRAGGTVVGCETEQVPFDDVFCSLVLGSRIDGAGDVSREEIH